MNKKIAFVPLLALSGLMSLSACGGGKQRSGSEDTIYVCVYDGGYGTDWIKTIAEDYERDTGIHVEWDADQSILQRLTSELKNPSYDIYMSHDITWQQYAAQGLLENLDSLYSDTVEGTNKTFKQRLCPGAEEFSKYDGHYYKVCYTRGAGGLVYNMDMFEANGWTVPTTYDELMQLCKDIVAADISVGLDTVVPIAWSGDREYYWDYTILVLQVDVVLFAFHNLCLKILFQSEYCATTKVLQTDFVGIFFADFVVLVDFLCFRQRNLGIFVLYFIVVFIFDDGSCAPYFKVAGLVVYNYVELAVVAIQFYQC